MAPVIAALPMYVLPEIEWANDALWTAIARRLDDAPPALTRGRDLMEVWTAPDLLLAQTCGFPLTHGLAASGLRLVATPCYSAPGCDGPRHGSMILVRADDPASSPADLAGYVPAINARDSNTGFNLLRAALSTSTHPLRLAPAVISGEHAASVQLVGEGKADLASVDCVTWALLQRHRPEMTNRLKILTQTPKTPGLPLVTRIGDTSFLRRILKEVLGDPGLSPARDALMLSGFAELDLSDYDEILKLEQAGAALAL